MALVSKLTKCQKINDFFSDEYNSIQYLYSVSFTVVSVYSLKGY